MGLKKRKRLGKKTLFLGIQKDVRHFFGAILVLPCLAVLVPGGALATLLLAAAAAAAATAVLVPGGAFGQQQQQQVS